MAGNASRIVSILAIGIALALVAGCSLSESSKSSSESSKSGSESSKSSSGSIRSSSGSSNSEGNYREDVRDFTAAYYKSNGRPEDLRRKISDLAAKHGISDWEENESTYRGIGEGLGKAGARQVEVDAFKQNLAATDKQADWIQKGYESAK